MTQTVQFETNSMDYVLTQYPISRDFQLRLEGILNAGAVRLNVTELRQRSPLDMVMYLRSLRADRLFLPLEDENGATLLPVLKILAALVPARETFIVTPDLSMERTTRFDAVKAMVRLGFASLAARRAVRRAASEVDALLAAPLSDVGAPVGRKVLYLNANLWFGVKAGGSVGHISGVVNALLQHGYEVDFVSAGGRLMVSPAARFVQLVPAPDFGLPWEYNYYRFHFDVVRQLGLRDGKPDFIYQRLSLANYSGVELSRRLSVPLVLEYNGSEAWVARNWGRPLRQQALAERAEEASLRHAHLVVTISDVLRDELLSRGLPPERIVSYPNCIDPDMFSPTRFRAGECAALRQRHGIADDAIVVTFVGTFGQWHGAEVLARAIALLLERDRTQVVARRLHFLLVGDGSKMPEVREILGDHARGPFVTLTGLVPQPEAPLYLAASDILASPHVANSDGSKFFGSPTKLFEYMGMGKAIIASDLDQIGEVLSNCVRLGDAEPLSKATAAGAVAMLVPPGHVESLADGILALAAQPELRAQLGRGARALVLERYTWRRHVQEILDGLRRCLRA